MARKTEGQRLLRQLVDGGRKQSEIAHEIKRSEPQVSLWLSGKNLPDVVSAARLEERCGIPAVAWAQKPNRGNGHKAA